MDKVRINQINDHIYLLNDDDKATGYIVIGTKKALVIDTMIGDADVKAIAEGITKLPVMLVNTHGHIDHIAGNYYFEEAYINPEDIPLADMTLQLPEVQEVVQRYGLKPAKWKSILPGEKIDLGDLELEVYGIAGHTKGSICILDRKDRILFTGDGIIEQIWMQLEESLPLTELVKSLDNLEKIRKDFDYILCGHGRGLEDASLFEALKAAATEVIEGKTENDEAYEWFGGVCKAHPYGGTNATRKVVYKPQS